MKDNRLVSFALLHFVSFTLLTSVALSQTVIDKAKNDDIALMSSQEPAMRRAFEKARATLDEFFVKAKSPDPETSGYALKVAIAEGRDTEYFWVNRFSETSEGFEGYLGNEPRIVKRVKYGEKIRFGRSQIVDWTYANKNERRTYGNYTACALLTKEPPAQARRFMEVYGLKCE